MHLLVVQSGGKDVNLNVNGVGVKEAGKRRGVYVGWTGMASSSSLARFKGAGNVGEVMETVEIDPQFASGLGLHLGDVVSLSHLYVVRRNRVLSSFLWLRWRLAYYMTSRSRSLSLQSRTRRMIGRS